MSVQSLIAQHGTSVTVKRPTFTTTGWGAVDVASVANHIVDVAFFQPRSSSVPQFAGRENLQGAATFYFDGSPDVKAGDIVTVGGSGPSYHVVGVRTPINRPTTSANCHTIVDTELRTGDLTYSA